MRKFATKLAEIGKNVVFSKLKSTPAWKSTPPPVVRLWQISAIITFHYQFKSHQPHCKTVEPDMWFIHSVCSQVWSEELQTSLRSKFAALTKYWYKVEQIFGVLKLYFMQKGTANICLSTNKNNYKSAAKCHLWLQGKRCRKHLLLSNHMYKCQGVAVSRSLWGTTWRHLGTTLGPLGGHLRTSDLPPSTRAYLCPLGSLYSTYIQGLEIDSVEILSPFHFRIVYNLREGSPT